MNIPQYFSRVSPVLLGLISGILIGITAVSLYLIYQYKISIYGFLIPVITAALSSFVIFLPNYIKISRTISSFISGILIVLTGFIIFIFFGDNILNPSITLMALASIILSVITFFSIFFLFISLERREILQVIKEEIKERKIEKPPMNRL
ncbi:MAG: hypothetical protein QXG55_01955 [Thermoplasmata archaeon]